MKVALINPPIKLDVALGMARNISKYTTMIPHGLASIAAVLRDNDIECIVIDAYAENLSLENIVQRVLKNNADIVGISAVTPVIPIANAIAKKIKEKKSNISIIMGGPHPSIMPGETLLDPNIDFVVRGEGEITFLKLVQILRNRGDVTDLQGLSYRKNGEAMHNDPAEFIQDLDTLPRPAYDILPMHLYTSPPQWSIDSPAYQLIATRGCPFRCGFCYVGMGKKVRYKSARVVCDEIEYLIDKYNCKQIVFVDTVFPFNFKHSKEVCNEMILRKINKKITWFTSTRADIVTQEMLDLMYEAGCRLITLGVESGNQNILNSINKGISLEQVRNAVRMAKKAKIDVTASYIMGLPGENSQTILNTIEFAKSLGTLYAQFNIIVPYPGTEVYKYAEKNGLVRNRNWSNYLSLAAFDELELPFITPDLTKKDLIYLQKKAYNNFYLRPATVMRHLKKLIINMEFKKYLTLAKIMLKTMR